jgi:hypothetical protein
MKTSELMVTVLYGQEHRKVIVWLQRNEALREL